VRYGRDASPDAASATHIKPIAAAQSPAAAQQLQCTGIKRGNDHIVGRAIRFAIRIIATIGRDDEAINRIKPNRATQLYRCDARGVANKSECVERRKDLVAANPARSSVGTGAPRTNSSMAERSAGDTESQSNSPSVEIAGFRDVRGSSMRRRPRDH